MNDLLGNRRCGARACNDDDKTWAESGSHPESKTGLSLYRKFEYQSLFWTWGQSPATPLRVFVSKFLEASFTETLMKLDSGRTCSYHFFKVNIIYVFFNLVTNKDDS